ncbi:hypothetical protein GG804_27065 [Sphingomonas histidinilytica]|uniref:hypothetical protein n=1 Tax=Rhizorhabdus histidinilytica TaxID=439228 RepID=UPI001ADA53F7|nr:hypothetical protein [Rhizorhabdus histidinilytica]MBO9380429.1 hypothetical protein [Rhizorhabdus histidinilytica]
MAGAREISRSRSEISDAVRKAQARMFDLAARKHGITLKVIELETDISDSTSSGWASGKTGMPLDAFVTLATIEGFPNALLSLPFEAARKTIADSETGESDIDDLAVAAAELLVRFAKARHRKSPSGVVIDHTERPDIELAAEDLADRAGKVANS